MAYCERNDLTWAKVTEGDVSHYNLLFKKETKAQATVYQDEDPKQMYWIAFSDGSGSDDYYNLDRAKEHAVVITAQILNASRELEVGRKASSEPADALFPSEGTQVAKT